MHLLHSAFGGATTRINVFHVTQGVTWKMYHVGQQTNVDTPNEESQVRTTSVKDRHGRLS